MEKELVDKIDAQTSTGFFFILDYESQEKAFDFSSAHFMFMGMIGYMIIEKRVFDK